MSDDDGRTGQWSELDAASDREKLLAFLDAFATLGPVHEAKRTSFELLDIGPGCRVLDAGCGTGVDVRALAVRVLPGGHVVGVDLSAAALFEASLKEAGERAVELARADLAALPFADGSFDAARADRAVQHHPRPDAVVRELVRVTRTGGRVVISEATFKGPTGPPRQYQQLVAFLPLLLHRSGTDDIVIETSEGTVAPGPAVLEVLGLPAGPVELRAVHVAATVTG